MGFGTGAWGGGPGWDIDDPSVVNLTPADLSDLDRMEPLEFDVLDMAPGLAIVLVWMKYSGATDWLLVYDGDDFLGTFARESEAEAIDDGKHFSVLPAGGWVNPFTIRVRALDLAGADGGS